MTLIELLQTHLPAYAVQVMRLCVWLLLLSVIFIPLERFFALHSSSLKASTKLQDIAYYFLTSLVPMALLGIPMALLAVLMQQRLPDGYVAAVAQLPVAVRWALVFVVGEIGFYWGHRLCHEIPWLWRFHAVHHAPEHLYFLVNTRAHPVDIVVTRLFGFVPIYVLGLAGPGSAGNAAPVMLIVLGTLWGFFIHSNLRVRLGPLEWLLSTPAFHHWHHSRVDHINRNYAAMLPVLDKLFGSYYLPSKWPSQYGSQTLLPPTLSGQLLAPFQPYQRSEPEPREPQAHRL